MWLRLHVLCLSQIMKQEITSSSLTWFITHWLRSCSILKTRVSHGRSQSIIQIAAAYRNISIVAIPRTKAALLSLIAWIHVPPMTSNVRIVWLLPTSKVVLSIKLMQTNRFSQEKIFTMSSSMQEFTMQILLPHAIAKRVCNGASARSKLPSSCRS